MSAYITSDYPGLNKEMKTRHDLPPDFINAIQSGEITVTHDKNYSLIYEWFGNFYKPLPLSFYEALRRKKFMLKTNDTLSEYENLDENMKFYSDLPPDFIAGIQSGKIIINPKTDLDLLKICFSNFIASLCRILPSRPLTILIAGGQPGHIASYIARISEDRRCELLSLNTGPCSIDKFYIKSLKEGIKKGLDLVDEDFDKPVYKNVDQLDGGSCGVITAWVLSMVDPDRYLSEQFNDLVNVMEGVIANQELSRRLIARILWWNYIFNSEDIKNKDGEWIKARRISSKLKQSMREVYKQLSYSISEQTPPTKITLSDNPEILTECLMFLNIFDIHINDKKFLKLFNRVNQRALEKDSTVVSEDIFESYESDEKYFNSDNWITNKENIINKFVENEVMTNDSKVEFGRALVNLVKHAGCNLNSKSTTIRASLGQEKYHRILPLFQESEDLEDLQKNIKGFLDVKNPDKSPMLLNRGGFFGAYKTFSNAASFFGAKHYKFSDRTAISRTDHYLIALSDAIDKIKEPESYDQSTLST